MRTVLILLLCKVLYVSCGLFAEFIPQHADEGDRDNIRAATAIARGDILAMQNLTNHALIQKHFGQYSEQKIWEQLLLMNSAVLRVSYIRAPHVPKGVLAQSLAALPISSSSVGALTIPILFGQDFHDHSSMTPEVRAAIIIRHMAYSQDLGIQQGQVQTLSDDFDGLPIICFRVGPETFRSKISA